MSTVSHVVTRGAVERAKRQTRLNTMSNAQKQKAKNVDAKKPTVNVQRQRGVNLNDVKKLGRERKSKKTSTSEETLTDIYQNASSSLKTKRGETGLIYDRRMAEHRCLWDPTYPECPERFTRVLERCDELQLLNRCHPLTPRPATMEEILLKHTQQHFDTLKATDREVNEEKLEDLSSRYDAVYLHPSTFELSKLAVGSTIELVDNILTNQVQNGMAIIRPPGHHAMKAEFNGYCFFNNVAIAAQHALNNHNVKRILIVDYDVHHGQGTQQLFFNDPRVLYFSIHRFEHGEFWPNLRESDYDSIGDGEGKGFNFNVPLNKTGMTNADYLAIWQQILIPVAAEFEPELIIVSAGYDAAVGCPEGEMEITPAGYAHLVSPLMALANGKIAVVLEGGYCLDSLAEGAALTLRTLLGDPCPLIGPLPEPCESIQESILNCIHTHKAYWACLRVHKEYDQVDLNNVNPQPELHKVVKKFNWNVPRPDRFPTKEFHWIHDEKTFNEFADRLRHLRMTTDLSFAPNRVCYVYDVQMTEHRNDYEEHFERPERIIKIEEGFGEYGLKGRMHQLPSREAKTEELCLAHNWEHVNFMRKSSTGKRDLRKMGEEFNSIYLHPTTFKCAKLAAGSTLEVVDNVLNGNYQKGISVVRPPGHHAEPNYPQGFCIFNNVALAAIYAHTNHGVERILIVDWDIHHGNGTQRMFEKSKNVLYISLHRYDNGEFYPEMKDADFDVVGEGRGEGFNVNIPWNKNKMGDADYITAFQRVIMPIAYEFNPELVLVSAGFDACVGDPIGTYNVSPEAFGYFTHWLSSLAGGRIILCLEGGYNVNSISHAMAMCAKALLGDPLPMLQNTREPSASCIETIQNVLSVQQKYWTSLKFNKKLPSFISSPDSVEQLTSALEALQCVDGNEKTTEQAQASGSSDQAGPSQPSTSQGGAGKAQTLSEYLSEHRDALLNEELFAVIPLNDCPHLRLLDPATAPEDIDTSAPCASCDSTQENWVCLHCFSVYCSRYVQEHMFYHHLETEHTLALSFPDLSVWCFKCDAYVDNPILYKYKNAAHRSKFGEELVWSYGEHTISLDTPSTSKI